MVDVTVKIEGLADIERKLKLLPQRVGRNALKRAMRKGANVIRDQARNNFGSINDPGTPENIAKNVVVQSGSRKREKQEQAVVMRIGVLGGSRAKKRKDASGNPGGDTWYWRLLEFGTSRFAAKAPMRKDMAAGAEKAFSVTAANMASETDKEIGKLR